MKRPKINTLFEQSQIDKLNSEKKIISGEELFNEIELKEFPVDIKSFVEDNLKMDLIYEDLGPEISGKLYKKDNKYIISVNKNHHINRQRFTIAHELAHYYLHKNVKTSFEDEVFFRGQHADIYEYQANLFASQLLMPEAEFLNQIKTGNSSIHKLASFFGVSTLAVRVRAKQLNLKGHGL